MIDRVFAYAVVGLAIGVLSGLFGVGGSSISTPLLRVSLDVPQLIALATPLPITIPTAFAGGFAYYRKGLVDPNIVLWTVLTGIPGVIAGAITTAYISGFWLMMLTGIVVMVIGLRLGWSVIRSTSGSRTVERVSGERAKVLSGIIGLVVGFFSGLLANGGGFLLVPAFILILGLSMHEAAGTSLVCVAGFAVPGTIVHWLLGHIDPTIMLSLVVAVIPASYLGARVALQLKSSQVQLLFGAFLVVFSWYFLYSEIAAALASH